MLKSLSVLTVLSSFLLHIGCTVPTIDAIDEDTLEQLQQQSNGAQSDAGTQPQTATDAGNQEQAAMDAGEQEQAAMDAGEQEQAATDAGEQEQAATDAGEQEQAATDAGDLACTPCSDGFVHITGTCDCVAEEESDAGSVACTPCEDGFEHETGTCNCVDIDDCTAGNNGGCGDNATCHNSVTPGNPPICTCDLAYELQGDTCVAQCTGDCTTAYSEGYGSHLGRICSDVGNECTIDNSGAQCLSDEECHYLDSLNETRCIQTCGYKRYFRFAVAEDFACGIQIEEPGIDCIGNIDPAHYQHLTGQYDDIACNGDSVCCVKESGGMTTPQNGFIQCFSSDESLPSWATPQTINTVVDSLPQTEFAYPTDITLGDNHGCFQYGAGVSHGYCWGTADHCDDASSNCEPSNPLACVSSERLCSDGYPVNDASINFIKTSATNTCVLVENDNFDRELNCTGRKGYGLGGETDIAPENRSLFPFYHLEDSTSITSGSQFDMLSASDTNIVFSVEGVDNYAFDTEKICVRIFVTPSMSPDEEYRIVCSGQENDEMKSVMLDRKLDNLNVAGNWVCGTDEPNEEDSIGSPIGSKRGPLYCYNIGDLSNVTSFIPFGSERIFTTVDMSAGTVCGGEENGGVFCKPLGDAPLKDLHHYILGQ